MKPFRGNRLQRKIGLAVVLVLLVFYVVCLVWNSESESGSSTRGGSSTSKHVDPYRFPLSHSWAWNDDVIYTEEYAAAASEMAGQSSRLVQEIVQAAANDSKSPSLMQDMYSPGQGGNYLGLEGVEDYILSRDNREPQRLQSAQPIKRIEKCTKPIQNVLFLKTHYTGSDVITNILNRFADLRDLKVAIPSGGVSTFYWPARFHWRYMDLAILDGALPNILCNYARYNTEIMDQIMHPGSAYITIIRDPLANFESTFRNLGYATTLDMDGYPDPLSAFLENPRMHIEHVIKMKMFKDSLNIIKNGMFFDLGLRTADYHKQEVVRDAILDIDEKFTMVLIYEYLDESLVLLKRRLCWELDDVVYLKAQYLDQEHKARNNFTTSEKASLRSWSKADVALYEYFNRTLWRRISYETGFTEELELFRVKQRDMEEDCRGYQGNKPSSGDSGLFKNMNRYLCQKMGLSDGQYLEYFRTKLAARKRANYYT